MESIRSLPFLKLLIPLILGILIGKYVLQSNWIFFFIFLSLSLIVLVYTQLLPHHSKQSVYIKSVALFFHILCWGFFLSKYQNIHLQKEQELKIVRLKGDWKKKKDYYHCIASTNRDGLFKSGDVLLRIKTKSKPIGSFGDLFITKKNAQTIQSPQNPFQFNYKKYLERKGIVYSIYLKEDDFVRIEKKEFHLKKEFLTLRYHIESILDSSLLDPHSIAFIKALFLGDKSELDDEISKAFTIAGATHVLAVSGLHVGIIVSLFSALLSLIKVKKNRKVLNSIKMLILLFIIWTFAGITGFSPSIVRASIMFSFISIGQLMTRHTNIYNSLSMAAFFMLFLDANYLFDVGFQLSFLAVLGIVYYHPRIYNLLYFKNKILQKVWSITAVSLAAQIATFPIAIYYFHQFPVYFILSNLIVIPAAFLVLLFTILLIFFHWIPFIATLFSFVLNSLIQSLNYLILLIQKLPFNSIPNIYIDSYQLLFLFLITLFLTIYLKNKKPLIFVFLLSSCCLFFASRIFRKIEIAHTSQIFIYSIYKHTAINIIHSNRNTLIVDSDLHSNPNKLSYSIKDHLMQKGLSSLEQSNLIPLSDSLPMHNSYMLKGKNHLIMKNSLLCINHSSHNDSLINHFQNRILLIEDFELENALDSKNYTHLILNTWYKSNSNRSSFSKNNNRKTNTHSIKEHGYFSLHLP